MIVIADPELYLSLDYVFSMYDFIYFIWKNKGIATLY